MKLKPDKTQITWGITIFLTAVMALLFYYLLFHGGNIASGIHVITHSMMAILYGVIIAYVMSPTLNFIEKKMLIPIYGKCGISFDKHGNPKKRKQMRKISVFMTIAFFVKYSDFLCNTTESRLITSKYTRKRAINSFTSVF